MARLMNRRSRERREMRRIRDVRSQLRRRRNELSSIFADAALLFSRIEIGDGEGGLSFEVKVSWTQLTFKRAFHCCPGAPFSMCLRLRLRME